MKLKSLEKTHKSELLAIQSLHLLSEKSGEASEKEALEQSGFLVNPLSDGDLDDAIENPQTCMARVALKAGVVCGYLMAYRLAAVLDKNKGWAQQLVDIDVEALQAKADEVLYVKHVAVEPSNFSAAIELTCGGAEEAKGLGYTQIIGEILESPYENKPSFRFHKRLGYKKIGQVVETERDYVWALVSKQL